MADADNKPKTLPIVAFLKIKDGVRFVCLGCSALLHKKGMLRVMYERPMPIANACDGYTTSVTYEIASPYTLADCQRVVQYRHIGPPEWGQ